ncbi:winged helix DNA-binding domain-containing protein [Kitasatospora sp. MBT63]|uniref:winged helix DNA-binding domain-containing protein n=1 Tax=Kitasatospora sp. MBT63 TaxID=1444768 RepID=UPI00053AC48E|nr:winged helix DNA-binding domain-containing protein [Kitasatospora sp. MBT63]
MTTRPRIDDHQRRTRLAVRQLLAPAHRAATPEQVADAVVALHATDPATVFLSTAARLGPAQGPGRTAPDPVPPLERALYEDGTLVRMHGMRHTLFVVPAALAPAVQASTTSKVAERERRGFTAFAAEGGFDQDWLTDVEHEALAALDRAGEATGAQLGSLVPRMREEIAVAVGKPYQAVQTIGTRMLRVLGMEGSIIRRRPVGSWTSGQHRWATHRPYPQQPAAAAQRDLTARWLAAYGPATAEDLRWWTGWGLREVRTALTGCGAVPVDLSDGEGFALPDDLEPVPDPEPWVALLPALDPAPMGTRYRHWFLPDEHRAELFDRSGNIGPTVWWNGRIVGGWAQRADGEIAWQLLGPVDRAARDALEAEAERLRGWIGDTRVTPRFRTPLERRLSA